MSLNPARTAIYLRVSSALQADANGTDSQRHAIGGWLQTQGTAWGDIPEANVYEDAGVSGKTMDRPAWCAMMARVRAGELNTVVLYDFARAGRTMLGMAEWLDEIQRLGVRAVSVRESFDLGSPVGRMLVNIMVALAEYEREVNAERIRAGVRAKIAKTGKWGAPSKFDDATKREIVRRFGDGETRAALSREYKCGHDTITRVLRTHGAL